MVAPDQEVPLVLLDHLVRGERLDLLVPLDPVDQLDPVV